MKKIKKEKIIIGISIFVFILLLIPLIYIARYNHSCADDYSYGILTHKTWINTHSIKEVIKTAIEQVKITYNQWQGTFVAVFLMALQPAIFGEKFYGISTIILICVYVLSNLYLFKVILKYYLKCKQKYIWCVFLVILMFSIQFVPYPIESFYWYNGSIFYTFFYSIMLLLIGIILKYIKEDNIKKKIFYIVISIGFAIAIGGSNYITALESNLILALITLILIIKKDKKWISTAGILLVCFISLMISARAPGNSIRQATMQKMSEINAIITSFEYSFIFIKSLTNKSILWLYIILIPFILSLLKDVTYKFKAPLLFTIITFCLYSAQFTPPVYAQNGILARRILNIIYFSTYWLIITNMVYWLGWLNNKINIVIKSKYNILIYNILIIFGIIILFTEYRSINSYIAIKSLISGEAKQYNYEIEEREKIYKDDTIKDVEVERIKTKPYLIFYSDISEDKNDWQNEAVTNFFNKNSVKTK